jgi:hypothetical protein
MTAWPMLWASVGRRFPCIGSRSYARLGEVTIVLDVVLMALVSVAIVSFLMWSICTQHRDAGGKHLRIHRGLQIEVS